MSNKPKSRNRTPRAKEWTNEFILTKVMATKCNHPPCKQEFLVHQKGPHGFEQAYKVSNNRFFCPFCGVEVL